MNHRIETDRPTTSLPAPLRALLPIESATFLVAAVLHLGVPISIGAAEVSEPRILPATVVEAALGVALGVSAFAAIRRRPWARSAAIAASAFSIGGVLLGMAAIALGRGPETFLNLAYHRVMLIVLSLGLLALLRVRGRQDAPPPDTRSGGRHRRAGVEQ